MDVVLIFNGLGNQMSQYAFYLKKKSISKNTIFIFSKKSHHIHNGYELEKVFGIPYKDSLKNRILFKIYNLLEYRKYPLITKPVIKVLHLLGFQTINELDDYNYHPEYLKPSKGIRFFVGGWHSEKYIADIKDEVKKAFQFDISKIGSKNLEVYHKMKNTESVSVHIRRGDFLDAANMNKFGGVCTHNYFIQAIEKMKKKVNQPHFYFFSNDYEWVKENFADPDFTIINLNSGADSWKDMFLISSCHHQINSNGSFSWWSAWLCPYPNNIVIVPKNFMVNRYFPDIYPPDWIQFEET